VGNQWLGRLGGFGPAIMTAALLGGLVAIARPAPSSESAEHLAWQPAGELAAPRAYGSAIALVTGDILVFGGLKRDDPHVVSFTTEIFDPVNARTIVLGQLLPGRVNHSATVGRGGRVIVAGGSEWAGDHWQVTDRVDVFIPQERRWIHGRPLFQARTGQRATALRDGRVLVTGGYDGPRLIGTTEIYDPYADRWSRAAPLPLVRGDFAITTLPDGRVLVAGGLEGRDSDASLGSLYYDPETDRWRAGPPLNAERVLYAQAKLPNGDLLLIGGQHSGAGTAERYDVKEARFVFAGTLAVPRMVADAAALPDGRVIVTGGLPDYPGPHDFEPSPRTELWDPATNLWRDVPSVASARAFARLVVTAEGVYQVSGVAYDDRADASIERFVWR